MADQEVIAEGLDTDSLLRTISSLPAGQPYTLRIFVQPSLTPEQLEVVTQALASSGLAVQSMAQDAGILQITFTKQAAAIRGIGFWPALIAIVAAGGFFGWQIMKTTGNIADIVKSIPSWVWLVGGAALVWFMFLRKGAAAAPAGGSSAVAVRNPSRRGRRN